MKTSLLRHLDSIPLGGLLLAAAALSTAQSVSAQQSYSFAISSSEAILESPDSMVVAKVEAWDSPLMRVLKHSRPFLEVTNTSSESADPQNLTLFTMTIGDTQYGFGDDVLGAFAVLGDTSSSGVEIASATASADGDEIAIEFGNGGLAPGETARFQIDIDPDDGVEGLLVHPDYRTVLFDLVAVESALDDSDNAMVTALFSGGLDDDVSFGQTLPDSVGSPSALSSLNAVIPYASSNDFPIQIFDTPDVIIPEPSALLMALIACLFSAAAMRQRLG